MSHKRQVTIHIDSEFCTCSEVDPREFHRVIGYLSTWAIDSERYAVVDIYDKFDGGNLICTYRENPGAEASFLIGAIYDPDKRTYSTHS